MDTSINGGTTTVSEGAYTNNTANNTATTLYTIDSSSDSIYIQNPANGGTQTSAQTLDFGGSGLDIVEARGFDIPSGVNVASSNSAVTSGNGFGILEFASNSQQKFCQIDLTSGAVSNDSIIGSGNSELLGLALQSAATTPVIGLLSNGSITRFALNNPATVTTPPTPSGLTAGETLVGLDYRPSNGRLYTLGVNATNNTATLYVVDPQTAALTTIGSAGLITVTDFPEVSSGYGFSFNPAVDRIRVVAGSGLNIRINPDSGALTAEDTALNGASTGADGASYTNSFTAASATTLYTIDSSIGKLLIQNPSNRGNLTEVGSLGANFSSQIGFDIPASVAVATSGNTVASGTGYAALTVSGVTSLYSINLATGASTLIGNIGDGSTALVGLALGEIEAY
jgi:hypothetical protein